MFDWFKRSRPPRTGPDFRNHEYHLRKVGPRWYLTNVFYVDDDGKYECL